jgi:hypothetical protein
MTYCHTCKKSFHKLGITRHRSMHRDRKEDCKITYLHGDTWIHKYSSKSNTDNQGLATRKETNAK